MAVSVSIRLPSWQHACFLHKRAYCDFETRNDPWEFRKEKKEIKGFNKSTMEDIAGEAELSPGTLYLYFKNKEELHASLTLRILRYLHIRVGHVNKEAVLTPEQKVEKLIEAFTFSPVRH